MAQTMIVPLDLFSNSSFKIIPSVQQHEPMVSKKRSETTNQLLRTICHVSLKYRVIRNDCRGFNNLSYTIHLRREYIYFLFNGKHSKFLLHTSQVLYMCNLCDSTNINTIIEFVPHVSGDVFNSGSDSYLQFRATHAPCLLKLCIPPSNGIVRWWLFHEFGAELPLDNCTPTVILNNPAFR